ncbi:hypothetical protein OSB04_011745 [Centaurea solstitialis]|uniref:Chromo domain-containing protein n=1 Tax=Centaurea solstitialis TaxID=347529 RepID=A0AA38TN48_9ASTR|nr:hypothetical protein OSB04_011745 [Centaurea solstitialis]
MEREKMNGYVFRQIKTYELYSFERGEVESKVMDQFKIVTRIGWVTHLLKMSSKFSRMRNTLNVSWLEKRSTGESSHDLLDNIQVDRNPRKVNQSLRIKDIGLMKVQWEHRNGSAWTWEPEAERRSNYTEIFHVQAISRTKSCQVGANLRADLISAKISAKPADGFQT